MKSTDTHFSPFMRTLHWTMAALILAMLFIGVGMVSTVSRLHSTLIAIHRPLGVALLVLVIIRIAVRFAHGSPALPHSIPPQQRLAAKLAQLALYAMMIAMPVIGWSMLSAGGFPITLFGGMHLPSIVPTDVVLFARLRALHTWVAMALFVTVLFHLAAALYHGLIREDGVLSSMTGWTSSRR